MSISVGDKVKVRLPGGAIKRGKVITESNFTSWGLNGPTRVIEYGVVYEGEKYHQVRYYRVGDLEKDLDDQVSFFHCDCGALKLKHPGHSYWCGMSKKGDRP